ncbi:MAG: pilus assembly protein PilM [Clostridia bacterium]|nr:pilus assembly protein PilM [Clostridia bacterium]
MKSSKSEIDRMFKGKERHLMLEVGNYNTKMIEVVPEARKINIEKGFIFATPPGTLEDDVIVNYDELVNELMARMKEEKITTRQLTVSLSSMDIITREMNVPAMSKKDVISFIKNNSADIFPVDLSEYTLAYTAIDAKRGNSKLLIAAIPNEIIEPYIKIAEKLNLILKTFSFSGFGLFNLFDLEMGYNAGTYAVIDLGSKNTNFIIVSDGVLMYNRVLKIGSDDITKEIAMHFKCTLTKGEKLKRDYNSVIMEGSLKKDDPVYIVADIFRNVLGGMLTDISTLIEFYNSNHTRNTVSKIYIIGIASKISGICEFVQTTLGVETEKIKSFDRVQFGERAEKNLKPRQVTLENCLGAVPMEGKRVRIIKGKLALTKWYQSIDPIVYKSAILVACLMILVLCLINFHTFLTNNEIMKYKGMIVEKKEVVALQEELNRLTSKNEANKKKMESVPEGAENHLDKLASIENLLSLYPLVEVTGYDFKVNSITLNCSCPDEIEFYALKNSEEFKALSGNATSIRNEKFTMKFTFDNTGKQGR